MSEKLLLLLGICLLACSFGCSAKSSDEVVIIEDSADAQNSGEVVFSDHWDSLEISSTANQQTLAQSTKSKGNDNSEITTMIDKYGNKTEMRAFLGHPRLASILMRTSPEGIRETFVYGQQGKVKPLPADMLDRALTASADELANSAGIYNTVSAKTTLVQSAEPLQPMPSYKFPVQNQPVGTAAVEETKQSDDNGARGGSDKTEDSQPPDKENSPPMREKPELKK